MRNIQSRAKRIMSGCSSFHSALRATVVAFALAGAFAAAASASHGIMVKTVLGVEIAPDAKGSFQYTDDYHSMKFFDDAFLGEIGYNQWQDNTIANAGPQPQRTLTYRFFGDRVIAGVDVRVEQQANPGLGGRNMLYLSVNGLDWTLLTTTEKQKPNEKGWQSDPLRVSSEQGAKFIGQTELWVRIVLANTSGKKTATSNRIKALAVNLELGDENADSWAAKRKAWGRLRWNSGWKSIVLDWADPIDHRPPHYYENADGWLEPAGADPHLVTDDNGGFPIRRSYLYRTRSPLSLAVFVKTRYAAGKLMARITVRKTAAPLRKLNVLWDGQLLATFDTVSFFDEQDLFVEIPGPHTAGPHELRIACGEKNQSALIRRISITGSGSPVWAEKPALSRGGRLAVLSAYYMPDPQPIPDSQVVEGRHEKQPVGMIFRPLQQLYQEHADFGGVRVVVRNSGIVAVRIGNTILLDGKPIEDSYIDFDNDEWDARGVLWYRVRPRLLQPGQTGQIYVRFRRRPAGEYAKITIPLENGEPIDVKIPYRDPGVTVDYVTTDKSGDTLYVYVRRSAGASQPGNVTSIRLDGKILANAAIYGADFPGNIALAVVKLAKPMTLYEYHVVGVETDANVAIDAQFRVLPFFFARGSMTAPLKALKPHHMNTAMWGKRSLAQCNKYDIVTTSMWGNVLELHPRIAYVFAIDEPDAHDGHGCNRRDVPGPQRWAMGLGWHARRKIHSGWYELIERQRSPGSATWMMINGTSRPLNWAVYGQSGDVTSTHPYAIMGYDADQTVVRESLQMAYRTSRPSRLYFTAEAFGFRPGVGTADGQTRGPTPAEYRQTIVQGIGCGIKGLTSWAYQKGLAGWQLDVPEAKAVESEITSLNKLIEQIEGDLLIAAPIDLATNDAGTVVTGTSKEKKWVKDRLWTSALLCGPDTIIVAAANHIPATLPGPPEIDPTRNATITVELPTFLADVTAFEVTENGLVPIDCKVTAGKALLKPGPIESGKVFMLKRTQ